MREKAKALVALLKDDERLRNERVRALKAKERFAQSAVGIGSDSVNRDNADEVQKISLQCMMYQLLLRLMQLALKQLEKKNFNYR